MTQFLRHTLPLPIVADPGTEVSLRSLLNRMPEWSLEGSEGVWITYESAAYLAGIDSSYWNPQERSTPVWRFDGKAIGAGFGNQTFVSAADFQRVTFEAGNAIARSAWILVRRNDPSDNEYTQYSVPVVTRDMFHGGNVWRAPTPDDVVAAARRTGAEYAGTPNSNDCHAIASTVAAAAGATLTDNTGSIDPEENEEGGFWRIAYRGSDSGAADDWQALAEPGDIIRYGWKKGSFHTLLVLEHNPDGSLQVLDNTYWPTGVRSEIGIHPVDYLDDVVKSTVTIYRLTDDGLYLIPGTSSGETLYGTDFDDLMRGEGGDDIFHVGAGDNTVDGGRGSDTYVARDAASEIEITRSGSTYFVEGDGYRDRLRNVEFIEMDGQRTRLADLQVDEVGDPDGREVTIANRDGSTTNFFAPFLDDSDLIDGQAVSASRINGSPPPEALTGDGARTFRVTLDESAVADFANALGVYEIDADGTMVDARMLFDDVTRNPDGTVEIDGVEAGHSLGFFIVQGGTGGASGRVQLLARSGGPADADGNAGIDLRIGGQTIDAPVFHAWSAALNTDGLTHARWGADPSGHGLRIAFEDLEGGGDRDFQDVVFRVDVIGAAGDFLV